jgi:hypothetical protein
VTEVALTSLAVLCCGLIAWRALDGSRARRRRRAPSARRILFPFIGRALSQPVLDATLRLARAEDATLVPAYLARVPLHLPLAAQLPRQCSEAMPLLEAIEHRAAHEGVAVDARIERGRTYRHALRELLAHEQQARIVVAADTTGSDGFDAADIAWLLEHAPGEILVLRPASDRHMRAPDVGLAQVSNIGAEILDRSA